VIDTTGGLRPMLNANAFSNDDALPHNAGELRRILDGVKETP
jgi:hypothetical protein